MRLTAAQIASYARGAGFPESEITTATAVALAEHRGNVDTAALGDVGLQTSKWGPSVGVWQIRSLKPAYLAKVSGADAMRDASKLTDPAYNAAAAHAIWGAARGWTPWSTYPGVMLMYLPAARTAVAQAPASTAGAGAAAGAVQPVGLVGDAADAVTDAARAVVLPLNIFGSVGDTLDAAKAGLGLFARLLEFISKAAVWLGDSHNWIRIVKVWAGTWMTTLGLLMFGWPVIRPAAETAANFIPGGKLATAAGAKVATAKANSAGTKFRAAAAATPEGNAA